MTDQTRPAFEEYPTRQRLLSNKLGVLLNWKRPDVVQTIGPFDLSAFDQFELQREKLIAACVEKLKRFTDQEIENILAAAAAVKHDESGWSRYLTEEISSLKRKTPPWFLGGFGHPDHRADFNAWTKMAHFTIAELTCLSIGINPREFSWKDLIDISTSKERVRFDGAAEFLAQRFEQFQRRFAHHGRDGRVSPRDFVRWADQIELEVHHEFIDPLRRFHLAKEDAAEIVTPAKQDKREVAKIAQLFAAMAIEQFGYNPRQPRSPATKEIAELAAGLGISVSQDTILKYLRLGASFISKDWEPGQR